MNVLINDVITINFMDLMGECDKNGFSKDWTRVTVVFWTL